MKKVIYRLRKECTKPYNKQYVSYGVEIIENGVQTQYIPNVFTKKSAAKKLVRLCYKYDIAPIHVPDIIEDMGYTTEEAESHCI